MIKISSRLVANGPTILMIFLILASPKAVRGVEDQPAVIELIVAERAGVARHEEPVTSGIPFPEQPAIINIGPLTLTKDREGQQPIHAHFKVLQRWDNGGIKWVLVDFQANISKPGGVQRYYLHTSGNTTREPLRKMAKESDDQIVVDTGVLKFVVKKERFGFFDHVWFDLNGDGRYDDVNEKVVSSGVDAGPVVWDSGGRELTAEAYRAGPKVTLEENNPLRAVIKIEGRHQSGRFGQLLSYVTRIHAFRGKGYVKVIHTFLNNDIENPMLPVGENIVRGIAFRMNTDIQGAIQFAFGGDSGKSFTLEPIETQPVALLFQGSSNNFSVARAEGLSEKLHDAQPITTGKRSWGWADLRNSQMGISVAVRDFWQQHPKAITLTPDGRMTIDLWPEVSGTFKLAEGLAKTHEFLLIFHNGLPLSKIRELASGFNHPLFAGASPEWYCKSNAFGFTRLTPSRPDLFPHFEEAVRNAVEPGGFFTLQENGWSGFNDDFYGMLNFGDFGHDGYWSNNEYDVLHSLLMQFVRTGDLRFLTLGEEMARHYADVDIRHSTPEHFNHKHDGIHTSGRWERGHLFIHGLIDHYYLTGYRRSMDAALEWGRWLVDEIPRRDKKQWGATERDVGWPLIALMGLDGYTQNTIYANPNYLKQASYLVHQIALPKQSTNIGIVPEYYEYQKKEGRYPGCFVSSIWEKRSGHFLKPGCTPWFTGVLLNGLQYYHMATGDKQVKASMLKAGDWLLKGSAENNYFNGPAYRFRDPAGTLRYSYPYSWYIFPNRLITQPYADDNNATWPIINNSLILSGLAYMTAISNDSRYLNQAHKLFRSILYRKKAPPPSYLSTRFTTDKNWAMLTRSINYYLYISAKNTEVSIAP